ncbi:MAG: response regulator receiver and domain protein [Phycisphaerales bacterium]|nr:response regulator receiver and domain protein [Phycisphaerales bacterium]
MSTDRLRILIVEDETLVGMGLQDQLSRLGHEVIGQAKSAAEALEQFRRFQPDLVLVDVRLDGGDGIELARECLKIKRAPMIVISAFSDAELLRRAGEAGVFGYLIKPVEQGQLAAQLEVAVQRFREGEQLRLEKEQLVTSLETRKLVERAKGIFMRRLDLDEPEAHKRLQQESQKRRISLAELAKKIIESEELLGG